MELSLNPDLLCGPNRLITPDQMYLADAAAIAAGTPGIDLMERAGRSVFREIALRWSKRPVVVLCGPGNNGGDGFVVARRLAEDGWPVRVAMLGTHDRLKGDAAIAAKCWHGDVDNLSPDAIGDARLIVDGLFGAGLARPVDGVPGDTVQAVNARQLPVIAIDIPSGIDGATGKCLGQAIAANLTVTFARMKPGHLLMPGRQWCGETVCADIGISHQDIPRDRPYVLHNSPELWRGSLVPVPAQSHKYSKGHAVVVSGGPASTGAARLAAMAALKTGAGLVTIASPQAALPTHASHLTSIMLQQADDAHDITNLLADKRKNAVAIGPAAGVGGGTRARVRACLASQAACVLDADALTSFAQAPQDLFGAILENPGRGVVLTPHDGEFARLFKDETRPTDSKWQRVIDAARVSGATVILKGPDTVIACPKGTVAINSNAPQWLATAGSGDVLTGIVTGLLARGVAPFQAAAAAVWLHGHAGSLAGAGLIAEELPQFIPPAIAAI